MPHPTLGGGCHCRAVRFEIDAPAALVVHECNCSICRMVGYLHLTVSRSQFRLLSGGDHLVTYTWNTGIARHTFCGVCGVKSFYVPRSHPDGYSVNARCLDGDVLSRTTIVPFDGAHWEEHVAELPHLPE